MKCPRCQHENLTQAKFCEECAAPLARTCSNCGTQLSATAKFCPECAHPASGTSSQLRFTSPESYTPKHLAEKILTSKSALEGERKQVTVLFADLKGSLELLGDSDPEEARELLDPVLEHMMEAVHRYEGTVNQVMGDGIMALFGAPLAHEDHAVRACYAALRMQESVRRYADEVHRAQGVPLQIRVGLNSGEVVVRSIGSDLHMDYTAVGQTTHLGARMEQMAVPGAVLLTAETLRMAEGFIVVKPLGPRRVKGLDAPVEVFELTGAETVRSRLHAAAARGLTRFVGRDAELDLLRQALERARSGHGQVVAVVGDPGVGKSRLYWEFTRSHRTQGWLILESSSVSYGKATAYLPIIDLLKAYFQIEGRDDARKVGEKVTGKLLSLDRALEAFLPALLGLLDVPGDADWERLDPVQRRQRTLDGVKRLLLRESQIQPLLALFEDLHWIDAETQALLDGLVESLPTSRLLLLVNYRPEYQHTWTGKTYYRQLRIDPLPRESAEELLRPLLGDDPSLEPLKQTLIERTEGNPLFLEESVRTLVETQVLVGERGAYRLAKVGQPIQVPATVQAILAARIDRLLPEDKRLLQAASVIGKDVPLRLLQAIAELPDDEDLRRRLGRLQAAEFLYEARLFPDLEYTFKHALTHDVAYGSLLHDRRRALHAKIADTIEALYSDRLAEQVDRLAHHAFRGELWEKAVPYLRQAGAKEFARSANRESATCFEQALVALQHLPETRETLGQAIDLRFDVRNSLYPLGELERIVGYLREAERLAKTLDDQRRLGWVSAYMSQYLLTTGSWTEARTFGESARSIAETLGDVPLQVAANYYLGLASFISGRYRSAEDYCRKIVHSLQGDLSRQRFGLSLFPAVMCRAYLAFSLAQRGEFDEGIAHGQDGVRISEALDHPYSLIIACWGLASLYGIKGEFSHAARLLERALALSRDWNLTILSPRVTGFLGQVYAHSGRVAEGLSLLQQAVKASESIGVGVFHSVIVMHLGEACVLADRLQDAPGFAGRALALARERHERGYEAWALRLLGEIASHRDPPDAQTAEGHYREALVLAGELDMCPLLAHCHLGLGKLYRRTGKREQAREHLRTATTMFREMDMRFWLEKAEGADGTV